MRHSKSYKEMKSHREGTSENPARMKGKSIKKGMRKVAIRIREKEKSPTFMSTHNKKHEK